MEDTHSIRHALDNLENRWLEKKSEYEAEIERLEAEASEWRQVAAELRGFLKSILVSSLKLAGHGAKMLPGEAAVQEALSRVTELDRRIRYGYIRRLRQEMGHTLGAALSISGKKYPNLDGLDWW